MTTEQVQYWGMWATTIMAMVTAWMAWRTAQMAQATREMAQNARDELAFMRDEADKRSRADVRVALAGLSMTGHHGGGPGITVHPTLILSNSGPSAAHDLRCYVWFGSTDFGAHGGHSHRKTDLLWCGDSESFGFEMGFRVETQEDCRRLMGNAAKTLTVLVTWRDAEHRAWALVTRYSHNAALARFVTDKFWPTGGGKGSELTAGDALLTIDDTQLLDEVERRISTSQTACQDSDPQSKGKKPSEVVPK
jgi:hypothetical protein